MFSLFNSKKKENPIANIFSDLSLNKKMSIVNFLLLIGVSDQDRGNPDEELKYLNSYVRALDVRSDQCMPYLEQFGKEQIIEDLKTLTKTQKEFLIVAAWNMIICDGDPNAIELDAAGTILESIGISEEDFMNTIQKVTALMKHFGI